MDSTKHSDSHLYSYKYPHPAVTADCCIFAFLNNELSVLLIRRGIEPFRGQWALPGGFMRINETAEECAARELFEETGYLTDSMRQFHTYSSVQRDPRERVVTVAFYALVKMGAVRGGDDADEARWFPVSQLPDLAFDHDAIVHDALLAMRRDVYFEPIGFELLPPTFSMAELQKIIETLTGETYDRRNFYNKMRHMQFVTEVSDSETARLENRIPMSLMAEDAFADMPAMSFDGSGDGKFASLDHEFSIDEMGPRVITDYELDSAPLIPGSDASGVADESLAPSLNCRPSLSCDAEIRPSLSSFVMNASHNVEDNAPAPLQSRRVRRSGVRYAFNALAFKKRKDKKGSGPITY